MILRLKGEFVAEIAPAGATGGHRCDEIALSLADLRSLTKMRPDNLHDYMGVVLMTKFVPEEK